MSKKGSMPNFETIDDYIANQSDEAQKVLQELRKIIKTAVPNAVEGFHRQVRKVTKTKGAFTNDMALMKLIYLAVQNISKKWTQPVHNWALTIQQLCIHFEGRLNIKL